MIYLVDIIIGRGMNINEINFTELFKYGNIKCIEELWDYYDEKINLNIDDSLMGRNIFYDNLTYFQYQYNHQMLLI